MTSNRPSPPLLTGRDAADYSRMKWSLIRTLRNLDGYEPAVDDMYIDRVARYMIYIKKNEVFLNSETATEYTFSRVADSTLKFARIIDNAIQNLALSRRDRRSDKTESDLITRLREAILRGMDDDARESSI